MTRIQLDLPDTKVAELEQLMAASGLKTKEDLFNNALTLLEWAIKEKQAGRTIASIDEQEKSYTEVLLPLFAAVSKA